MGVKSYTATNYYLISLSTGTGESMFWSTKYASESKNIPWYLILSEKQHGKQGLQYFPQQKGILEDLHKEILPALNNT
jgi:hypothetical protein